MTYTPDQLVTFLGALAVIITAIGVAVVNIIVALRTGAKTDALMTKADNVANRVEQVHTLTNSNLSAVKSELTIAATRIDSLTQTIADLRSERQVAQLTAAGTPTSTDSHVQQAPAIAPLPNAEPTAVRIIATVPVPVQEQGPSNPPAPRPAPSLDPVPAKQTNPPILPRGSEPR